MPENSTRPSVFVPKVILSGGEVGRYGPAPQAAVGLEFHNGTADDIIVVTRTGVQIEIPPLRGARFSCLAIVSRYQMGYGVNVDNRGLLNDQGHTTSLEAEKIDSAVFRDDRRRVNTMHAEVEYRISRREFHENGGALYLSNLDLVVSIVNRNYAPKHPYSKIGLREAMIENDPLLSRAEGLSYQIKIVDRHGQCGDRFINVNGKVFHIRPTINSNAPDGVYVCSPVPSAGSHDMLLPHSEFYPFEVAEKELNLFKTYQDALTLGNPEHLYKRELEERAHALKVERQQWEEDSHRRTVAYETLKRKWEEERDAFKLAQAAREEVLRQREYIQAKQAQEYADREAQMRLEAQRLKEETTARDHQRRERLEMLKYIPALITGLGAIAVAVQKLKK